MCVRELLIIALLNCKKMCNTKLSSNCIFELDVDPYLMVV